jgi:recombination protein RecA
MFGDPWTTSGGKALPFHASTRIRLKNMGQIKDTKKDTIGIKIRAQVIKNRLGPPLRSAEFPLFFDKGIDDYGSWLTVMKDHKLVKQAGAWYTLDMVNDETGEVLLEKKFQSKDWNKIVTSDEKLKSYIYDKICDATIMKYKTSNELGIDDVVMETESEVVSTSCIGVLVAFVDVAIGCVESFILKMLLYLSSGATICERLCW